MTPEDVKKAVREALHEEQNEFWIPQPDHYTDHTWVRDMRKFTGRAKDVGFFTTISTLVGVILLLIWMGVRESFKR